MSNATTMRSERQPSGGARVSDSPNSNTDHDADDLSELVNEISVSVERYCRNRPRVVAGVLFAFGFVVGWKAKPW